MKARLSGCELDDGAVIYFLRKVIWIVPGFTVDSYCERLLTVKPGVGGVRSDAAERWLPS